VTEGIIPGCVFHWTGFEFDDGNSADKFVVVLGAKTGCNYLVVLATSQQHRRTFTPGCNADAGYYFIPGGGKDFFPKDTWILLAAPYEFSAAEVLKACIHEKKVTIAGHLREQVANAIRNCLKQCPDASAEQIALL
jgi:hypothetical protein